MHLSSFLIALFVFTVLCVCVKTLWQSCMIAYISIIHILNLTLYVGVTYTYLLELLIRIYYPDVKLI